MLFRILIACFCLLLSCLGFAEQWRCKNEVEISCSEQSCTVNSDFTAMDITVEANGQISVCAYTGCWEGEVKVTNNHSVMTMTVEQAEWKTAGETSQRDDLVLVIDQSDQIGFIKVTGFAQPLLCQKSQ